MTYKFQQIKPQKARGVLKESMWTDPDWVAEEKYDGDRRIAQFVNGIVRFTGSKESVRGGFVEKTDNLPHLVDFQDSLYGTVLDGEIIAPAGVKIVGGGSKYVTSIMGSSPEEAIRKQKERGWLRYVVFDCLYIQGQDIRAKAYRERARAVLSATAAWNNPHVSVVEWELEGKKAYYEEILKRGGEGVILKHKDHTYGNEKLWVKVKGEWTADVVVMGYTPGKGKYKGQIGAIIPGQYRDGKLWQCSRPGKGVGGFTDVQRMHLSQAGMGKKAIGLVFRLIHNGREPTGAFRHPRFDCWRPDKNPKDCVYDPEET